MKPIFPSAAYITIRQLMGDERLKKLKECMLLAFYLDVWMVCMILANQEYREKGQEVFHLLNASEQAGSVRAQEGEKGKIAITFDDGPHPLYTEPLLEGLKERGITATFFVTGKNASLYPEIIRRIEKDGHLIGNHTYYHTQLTKTNKEAFKEELIRTNEIIYEITGDDTEYVRPPYGSWDKKFEKELNMFPVLWTVDPQDWCKTNVSDIANSVIRKVEENDIILMHDYFASSVKAALQIVDELKRQGYEFVTVEEILFD